MERKFGNICYPSGRCARLIEAWREDSGGREFPFLYVELPDYFGGTEQCEAVREAQRRTLERVTNTGISLFATWAKRITFIPGIRVPSASDWPASRHDMRLENN
ncbi:hypothetical protein [Cohnella phaseoli]|uniref:hypothetical protein n=1 Tax=Cohnella phaseoli TaxID=456490 RepID=UPI000E24B372|nr:hypothetical protein [Cohnella phaseoli]